MYNIVDMSAGRHHSAAITECGKLFSWGHNPDGRIFKKREFYESNGKIRNFFFPQLIELVDKKKNAAVPKSVSCGFDHTLVIDKNGLTYATGSNVNGQLGFEPTELDPDSDTPYVHIDYLKGKVKKVSAGKEFSVLLTEAGEVYSCGLNTFSRLGLGYKMVDTERVARFTQIDFFKRNKIKIKDIVAGGRHCLAKSEGNPLASAHTHEHHP